MIKGRICMVPFLFAACLMVACNQINSSGKKEKMEKVVAHRSQNIRKHEPMKIDTTKPVATFEANMQDQVDNNDFIVRVFPTNEDDKFTMDIQYGGNTASDELSMIPSKYYKRIALLKGSNNNECIVGFIDNDGKFNKMRLITGSGTSISIKTLKKYFLSTK